MDTFSERQGYKGKKPIQFESVDEDLRIRLWNALDILIWSTRRRDRSPIPGAGDYFGDQPLKTVIKRFWVHHLNRPLEDLPSSWGILKTRLRDFFFGCPWYEVYDSIEYLASKAEEAEPGLVSKLISYCNGVLEREQSAYRFVGGKITPVTNEVEVHEIERALVSPYDAVRLQIQSAVEKLSEKPEPDLRNCIKESIGAVETAVRLATNDPKGTLGTLLPKLKEKLGLHSAQVAGFQKLYGYTSDDEAGIRHGMMDKDGLSVDDARYMLVTCSAFANYLLCLFERAGILKP